MAKVNYLVALLVLLPIWGKAQFVHYVSYNTSIHSNFFNKEKDRTNLRVSLSYPMGSYKIENGRWGLEAFFNYQLLHYQNLSADALPDDMFNLTSANLGLAAHYLLLKNKRVNLNVMLGAVKNWYAALLLERAIKSPTGFNDVILYNNNESKWGLFGGVNINVPIYKRFYTNANIRYSIFPTGEFNKRNLITEFGIGYRIIQNKKRTVEEGIN